MKTKEEIINDNHFKVWYDENGNECMFVEHALEAMETYKEQFTSNEEDIQLICDKCCDELNIPSGCVGETPVMMVEPIDVEKVMEWLIENDYVICKKLVK